MRTRPTVNADLPAILEILNREIREGVAHFGTSEMTLAELGEDFLAAEKIYPWWTAEDEHGHVTAVARCSAWKPRGAYARTAEVGIYVRPECQGQGVGKALYGPFLAAAKAAGLHTLLAGIAQPNESSVRLHEAFGFRHVGTLPEVGFKFGHWHDVGYWALSFEGDTPC